jgi:hypothetical protein
MAIIFFTTGNPRNRMPKNSNHNKSKPDDLKKAMDDIAKSSGDIFEKHGNLDTLGKFISALSDSNSQIKMGNIILEKKM